MASRWAVLLVGVILLQGLVALSPVPVPENEWEEFFAMLNDPQYRLPTTSRPTHYEVTLTPYLASSTRQFTFDGQVTIQINVFEATNQLVLHCNDLVIQSLSLERNGVSVPLSNSEFSCEMPYSFLRVTATEVLPVGSGYVLRSTFTGNLQSNMRGFYRSWYKDSSGERRWMATTQFQPGHARQAFPCYDEPGFKATFDFTIVKEPGFSPTIANMPLKENSTLSDNSVSETFFTTPLMSTYLIAFIVSHYKVVATNNNSTRPFHIYARDNAGITGDWALEVGVQLLEVMENYTQIPYYEMAAQIDMKQTAIPDFSAGAMENWALLTYREALILYDPLNSNHFYKQRIANIVSHEVAHMWFGNLVTCAWWDNLWLNEGFARFYQYFLTQKVVPELGYDTRFIVEQLHVSLLSDSVDSAHALTDLSVNDPTSVSAHFSTITYARGASVLRMTQYLLGQETYDKALVKYLSARKWDVAEPHHLFEALDAAAVEDGALSSYGGITIDTYFRSWSEKAGHPLLDVRIDHASGLVTVSQARWERDTGVSQFDYTWDVPITWTRAGSPDFNNLKPSQFIRARTETFSSGKEPLEWLILNKQQSGFYRVNYDRDNWVLLTRALRSSNRTVFHEYNRAHIVDDLFNFARAGIMPYNSTFNILSFLENEDQYAPWIAAITGFNFVRRRLAHDSENLEKLQNRIIASSRAVASRLGYSEKEGEPFMDGLLRMYLMTFLCDVGDPQCLAAANTNFQQWRNGAHIPANMRPWVYCAGLRQGTAADFNYFWNRYLNEDLAGEIVVMLQAAGCTKDTASLEVFLNAIVDGQDTVRPQDHSTALSSAVTGNEENTLKVFDWLKRNLDQTINGLGSAATPINNIGSRLLNEQQMTEFRSWLDQNRDVLGTAYSTGVNAITTSRNNLAWSGRRLSEFVTFFDTGYVDEKLTFEDLGEEDGGATIAALSAITLLITLSINIFA
ncbi:membrane alanyl aminopeptidase-like [Leptidea sinapis]|uniref:membrane alanyl aminopeptidase-like n=1 Tax=Leptidea sinapis TaxID=189913 RepID=UPI0021363DAC|nr:membrane alanyl aminopeptidase-like [Leptidea sinapis]